MVVGDENFFFLAGVGGSRLEKSNDFHQNDYYVLTKVTFLLDLVIQPSLLLLGRTVLYIRFIWGFSSIFELLKPQFKDVVTDCVVCS